MAQTPTKRTAPAKAPGARKRATPTARPAARRPAATRTATGVDRTRELSDEVLESVERGQRTAIEAVRHFVDTVDHAFPALPHGEGPSRRQEVIDSALEMADRLVHTQYDFIRKVIDSTAKTLNKSDGAK